MDAAKSHTKASALIHKRKRSQKGMESTIYS